MQSTLLILIATMAVTGPTRGGKVSSAPSNPTLSHCLVSVKDEVQVPAQEPGVLSSLVVREGMLVRKGSLLGSIDDTERQMQKRLALIEHTAAREQAENDINVRYAIKAAEFAEAEYQQALDANAKVRGTFAATDVRRLKLGWHRAVLQIDQAKLDLRTAAFTADSRAAEVEAADTNISRRQIVAPLDGEVVDVVRHAGEWVQPGEPVLRIVRLDTLRIEGFLSASQYDPSEVANRPVTVAVTLARGRDVKLTGKIVYVSSLVQAGGEYRVWAEVTNRREEGQWLLRPGLKASMTIHVD